jgi:exonuclease SbcC
VILERLFIQNYKQLRDPVELYPPEGAVGVVGTNGAGKSTLFESILWAFLRREGRRPALRERVHPWSGGTTRTPTTVEITLATTRFLYRASPPPERAPQPPRRLMSAGKTIVSGTADVSRWVEKNLLGMDRTAFEATFLPRQKICASSAHDDGISRAARIADSSNQHVETSPRPSCAKTPTLRYRGKLLECRTLLPMTSDAILARGPPV